MESDPLEASLFTGSKISIMYDGQIIEVSDASLDAKELLKVVITIYLATHGIIRPKLPDPSPEDIVDPTIDPDTNHTDGPYI